MRLVMVIHGTFDTADHSQRSCVAPPHSVGSLCWMTSKVPESPAVGDCDRGLADHIPAARLRDWGTFWPAVGVGHRTMYGTRARRIVVVAPHGRPDYVGAAAGATAESPARRHDRRRPGAVRLGGDLAVKLPPAMHALTITGATA